MNAERTMHSVQENGCSRFSCWENQTLYSNQLIMILEAVTYLKDVKGGHCCCFAAEVKIFRLEFGNLNSFRSALHLSLCKELQMLFCCCFQTFSLSIRGFPE